MLYGFHVSAIWKFAFLTDFDTPTIIKIRITQLVLNTE